MIDGHDPLTVLHDGDLPVSPDPAFAARLRLRLETALALPNRTGDVIMSGTDLELAELGGVARIRQGDIGYVSVWTSDAARSAAFYGEVLGWQLDSAQRHVTNTDQPIGIVGTDGPPTLFCCYAVDDIDTARQAILDAGGQAAEASHDAHGPTVEATDPSGTRFAVYQPTGVDPRPALNGTGPGELSYVTFEIGDSAAFRDFYGRVLGWSFTPGRIDDGWEPTGVHPMTGIAGGSAEQVVVPMWTVADIDAAVARVRAAGGTVIEEPSEQSYGWAAQCVDDQGVRFYLGQH